MAPRDVDRLQEELEELVSDLWSVPRFSRARAGFRPRVDCFHTDKPHRLTVVVELPGVDPRSVRVAVGERVLAIAGERPRPRVPGRVYQQMEIAYGPFERRVRLVEDVDPERATAVFEHGVLTISMPAADHAPARGRVTIEVWRT
jgi:HSP20 family protein